MEPTELREFRARIGKAIRRLREEEGISAQYLAKVLRVTQPTVSRIESGTSSISSEKLCFLSKTFNRPIAYFIGEQSPISYDEVDILYAGLAYYGATQIKYKRTINVPQHYKTYTDFLNIALNSVEESRIAAALATTLYFQAAKNNLPIVRIITTLRHKLLISNLRKLIWLVIDSYSQITQRGNNKKLAIGKLTELNLEIEKEYGNQLPNPRIASIDKDYVAEFINNSSYHG